MSKAIDSDPQALYLRSQDFYDDANIKVLLKKKANHVNTKEQFVKFEDGDQISFDKLLVATGMTLLFFLLA